MKTFEIIEGKKVQHDKLPAGCIISGLIDGKRHYGRVNSKKELTNWNGDATGVSLLNVSKIKVYDIVNTSGDSVYTRHYIATDADDFSREYGPEKPKRRAKKWFTRAGFLGFANGKELGQKWTDEPWAAWFRL